MGLLAMLHGGVYRIRGLELIGQVVEPHVVPQDVAAVLLFQLLVAELAHAAAARHGRRHRHQRDDEVLAKVLAQVLGKKFHGLQRDRVRSLLAEDIDIQVNAVKLVFSQDAMQGLIVRFEG